MLARKQGIGVRVMRSGTYKVCLAGMWESWTRLSAGHDSGLQAGRWEADQLEAALPLDQCQAGVRAARTAAASARRCLCAGNPSASTPI